jgi:hypothetical protein
MTLALSAVSISNMALVKLGQEPITSLSQDTKNARLCNAVFEVCRNEVLESHPWYFATKTVELASVSGVEDTLNEWTYVYQLPADFLKLIRGEDWNTEFEIRDQYLLADDEPLLIKYIFENTNPGQWSYSFAQCLSWRVAAEISYAVTKSNTVAQTMMAGFEMSLKQARYNDAHKKSPENMVIDDFLSARG